MTYPPRIHLITGLILQKIENDLLSMLYENSGEKSLLYYRIIINTTLLPANITFYTDPNFESGVYTYDIIPFKYIDYIYEIDMNDKEKRGRQIWPILTNDKILEKIERQKQIEKALYEYYKLSANDI